MRIYELVRITAADKITIGHDVIIDDFTFLQGGLGLRIGNFVHIASFASITGGGVGVVEDFATVSSGARVFTGTDVVDGSGLVNSTIPSELRAVDRSSTRLGRHCFVGANSVILPGVTLGEGSVVGAGSVVRTDLEPWTVYAGSPCKPIRQRPSQEILARARRLSD